MKWVVNETLVWALGIALLSAIGCFAQMAYGPSFGQDDTAQLRRVLEVSHSPLAFIAGGALALAITESLLHRRAAAVDLGALPTWPAPERWMFGLQALVVLFLVNCHRIVPALDRVLN